MVIEIHCDAERRARIAGFNSCFFFCFCFFFVKSHCGISVFYINFSMKAHVPINMKSRSLFVAYILVWRINRTIGQIGLQDARLNTCVSNALRSNA